MKKSLLLGIVGLAAGAVSSFGQGQIFLDNYNSSAHPLITYGTGAGGTFGEGLVGSQWTVGLYYVVGTVAGDATAGNGLVSGQLGLGTGTGSTVGFLGAGYAGQFASVPTFVASTATTATTITVEIIAYNGTSYADSTIRGHSTAFQMSANVPPIGTVLPVGDFMSTFAVSQVSVVPEPSTLALAGLGGFGMLMALRRKKA